MKRIPSLYQELINNNNRYLNDSDSYSLVLLYNKFIFSTLFIGICISLLLLVFSITIDTYQSLSFNDYLSLTIGCSAFYYSFKLIKNKIILHYLSNPIMMIGIIYPSFFVSSTISSLLLFNPVIKLSILILTILICYFILNKYYQSVYHSA